MKKISIIMSLMFFLLLSSCESNKTINNDVSQQVEASLESQDNIADTIKDTTEDTINSSQNIIKDSENINQSSNIIKDSIRDRRKITVSDIQNAISQIDKSANHIKNNANNIITQQEDLIVTVESLEESTATLRRSLKEYKKLEEEIVKKNAEIQELESDLLAASTKYIGMLIAIGVVIMILGGLGFLWNPKVGIVMLGIGALTTGVASAVIYYFGYFAMMGLIVVGSGFLGLIIIMAYMFIKGNKLEKANEENIELIEIVKQELPEENKKQVFGDKLIPGIADLIQSNSSKKIVQKVREKKIKPKINSTIPNMEARETLIRDGKYYIAISDSEADSIYEKKS